MTLLESIASPADLRRLDGAECEPLAEEIRDHLVATVAGTGGHLGPNLGVVELTMGIHRVFDSPRDTILFDVGHQAYVHKLLTGRRGEFSTLRQRGGLSGYPSRSESDHDVLENSHASASLSWADGIAKARGLSGETDRHVVAVIGDGALTGGLAWEALNTIAADKSTPPRRLVIVVNDNGLSYAPTVGGIADHLGRLRTASHTASGGETESFGDAGSPGQVGSPRQAGSHGQEAGPSEDETSSFEERAVQPQYGLFGALGIKCLGPVDGHDLAAVEEALQRARQYDGGPIIVHLITEKGHGYDPALNDDADQFHSVGVIDPSTGRPAPSKGQSARSTQTSWTSVFGDEILEIAQTRDDIVAVTAAMLQPVGLAKFAEAFPDRVFDVGIAEQHAVASAAGLSFGGLHPVVCLYATFLSRAFDQVLMDVALHRQAVTFVLDRAGVTGPDGASHHGIWDMALLRLVPALRLAAPRDGARLVEELNEAVAIEDGPSVIRFPRGSVGADVPAIRRLHDGVDILRERPQGADADVLIVSVGPFAERAGELADRLAEDGVRVSIVDPRWVLPVPGSVIDLAMDHSLVAVIEDGIEGRGVGAQIRFELSDAQLRPGVLELGVPVEFLPQGSRVEILDHAGLDVATMAREILRNLPAEVTDRLRARARTAG
ncbi:MAG: 1-deoxy-D-xylulose-5-phosphate synthase [Brevibacterium sp.]